LALEAAKGSVLSGNGAFDAKSGRLAR